jgi:hypothetical protein
VRELNSEYGDDVIRRDAQQGSLQPGTRASLFLPSLFFECLALGWHVLSVASGSTTFGGVESPSSTQHQFTLHRMQGC